MKKYKVFDRVKLESWETVNPIRTIKITLFGTDKKHLTNTEYYDLMTNLGRFKIYNI